MISLRILAPLITLLFCLKTLGQATGKNDYWVSFSDSVKDEYGYKNKSGDTVIPLGKYTICFTDTFRVYAIVLKSTSDLVAIDRRENILYHVFSFDNGPDYPSNGTFRIIDNKKIGYAEASSGKILIAPKFACAYPFKNGIAKVSTNCETIYDDDRPIWVGDDWFYIDRTGKRLSSKSKRKE